MKIADLNKDYIVINDENYEEYKNGIDDRKIHLIYLNFNNPTREKVITIVNNFNRTNRYIISDNIKFYNDLFKTIRKKYYVMNNINDELITFFRKNNKILLNFNNLPVDVKDFICRNGLLTDILKNVEVIMLCDNDFDIIKNKLEYWNGNIILS